MRLQQLVILTLNALRRKEGGKRPKTAAALFVAAALLTSCTTDPLRRHRDDFPPPVPKSAPDGAYPMRKGWIVKDGGVAWRWEFLHLETVCQNALAHGTRLYRRSMLGA
jgi:hypothetical protein